MEEDRGLKINNFQFLHYTIEFIDLKILKRSKFCLYFKEVWEEIVVYTLGACQVVGFQNRSSLNLPFTFYATHESLLRSMLNLKYVSCEMYAAPN